MDFIKAEYLDYDIFPVIPMRGVVAFPKMVVHFDVMREKSVNAIKEALKKDRKIFIITQKDVFADDIKKEDLYKIGVVAEIRQVLRTPDDVLRILVEGDYKAKLVEIDETEGETSYYEAAIKKVNNNTKTKVSEAELEAMTRSVKDAFERYAELIPRMPSELVSSVLCQDDPEKIFENIVFNANLQYADKQDLLEQNSTITRLTTLLAILTRETEVLGIEHEIHEQVRDNINQNQRDFFLREQLKVISSQLGEDGEEEENNYLKKIASLELDKKTAEKLSKEAERLSRLPSSSQEAFVIRNYLDTVLQLPWNTESKTK